MKGGGLSCFCLSYWNFSVIINDIHGLFINKVTENNGYIADFQLLTSIVH